MSESPKKSLRRRNSLPHEIPSWIDPSAEVYFLTINCRGRGKDQLCIPAIAEGLIESALYRHQMGQWFARLFLLMPDHVHALVSFPNDGHGIAREVGNWKAWTAKRLGILWQRDFFEHRLRTRESFEEKASYIRNNPVRAGLVSRADIWPWVIWSDTRSGEFLRNRQNHGTSIP